MGTTTTATAVVVVVVAAAAAAAAAWCPINGTHPEAPNTSWSYLGPKPGRNSTGHTPTVLRQYWDSTGDSTGDNTDSIGAALGAVLGSASKWPLEGAEW